MGTTLSYQSPVLRAPAWWFATLGVSERSRLLLGMVAESVLHGRRVQPGETALAAHFGVSPRSVRRAIRELREGGFIRVVRLGRGVKARLLLARELFYRLTGRRPGVRRRPMRQTIQGVLAAWRARAREEVCDGVASG